MSPPVSLDLLPATTTGAPHVRDGANLERLLRRLLLALLPCAVMALYDAGQQTHEAMDKLGLASAPGWRGSVLEAVGLHHDPSRVVDALLHGLLLLLPIFLVALLTTRFWVEVFSRLRRQTPSVGSAVTALLFTLCLPPSIPLWQVAVGITFGVVIGQEVFGGTGRNLVHPAVAGFLFLYFAYPTPLRDPSAWVPVEGWDGTTALAQASEVGLAALEGAGIDWSQGLAGRMPGMPAEGSALACLFGAAVLLWSRIASWRILVGGLIGVFVGATLFQLAGIDDAPLASVPWYWHLTLGGLAFGLVFLATDPATAAITNPGRWMHGFLVGALAVLIRVANPSHVEGIMLAVLLGNVSAPLIDHGVVWIHVRRRRRA